MTKRLKESDEEFTWIERGKKMGSDCYREDESLGKEILGLKERDEEFPLFSSLIINFLNYYFFLCFTIRGHLIKFYSLGT